MLLLQLMIGISCASEVQSDNNLTIEKQTSQEPINTKTQITNDKTINSENNQQTTNNKNFVSESKNTTTQKNKVNLTVDPIKGVIGENITLTAHILDTDKNPITGGNLVFKLNGKTLRKDGRFDSNEPSQKFKVEKGLVSTTIKADYYLRKIKNITVSYSGTKQYEETKSKKETAQIRKRDANLTLTVSPKTQKHYQTITFTAKLTDTTKNYKNTTAINQGTKVLFKINGVSLKNKKGKKILTKVENGKATYNYTIPQEMSGITKDGKTRNYTVEAVLISNTYYPDTRDKTIFNVQRNPTKIILNSTSQTTYNKNMTIKGKLLDTHNNTIKNTKIQLSINGKIYTLKTDTKGGFQKTLKADKTGTNNITVAYHGNTNYLQSKSKTKITVNKIKTRITFNIKNKQIHASDYLIIEGKITDEYENPLKNVEISMGKTKDEAQLYSSSDENGEIEAYPIVENIGKQQIRLSYNGNDKYAPTEAIKNFTADKMNTKIELYALKPTKLGEKITISGYIDTIDFNGDITNPSLSLEDIELNIKINNETLKAKVKTDEYYSFTYEYKTKTLGTNNITIIIIENDRALSSSISSNFLVYTPTSTPITIPVKDDYTSISRGFETYGSYTYADYIDMGYDRSYVEISGFELEPPVNKIIEAKFYLKNNKNATITKMGILETPLDAYIDYDSSLKPYKAVIKMEELTATEIAKLYP